MASHKLKQYQLLYFQVSRPILIQLPVDLGELRTFDFERQMDVILDAFESSWKKGLSPSVTEYAALVENRFQKRLLRELILTERECFRFLGNPTDVQVDGNCGTVESGASDTACDHPALESEMDCDQPTHFDRFEIRKLLGRGSHGMVYEAEDLEIRRRVALKIAYSSQVARGEGRAFVSEAANASRVEHPSIVRILEVGEYRGTNFMVSELVEGSNLSEYSDSNDLSDMVCAQIVADVSAGVHAAHQAGVIHRDLKPPNIMIQFPDEESDHEQTEFGASSKGTFRVRILDFGIAKMLDRATKKTQDGDVVGTPHYMSPEQASGHSANVDQRSDIFSLGVILFELLSGKLPFDGLDIAVVAGIRDLKVPSIRTFRPDTPAALERIVHKCLERNPAQRYNSAAELEADLRKWIAGKKPFALQQYQLRRFAYRSILVASAFVAIATSMMLTRSAWFSTDRVLPFSGIAKSTEMSEARGPVSNSRESMRPALKSWLKDGLPQSLAEWMRFSEGNSAERLVELEAIRFENDWDTSEHWRIKFARMCLLKDEPIEPDALERLAQDFVTSLEPSEEKSWSNILVSVPDVFALELESQVNREWQQRQRQTLFGILTARCENLGDMEGLVRLLRVAGYDELNQVIPAFERRTKRFHDDAHKVREMLGSEFAATELKSEDSLSTEEESRWRAKLALVYYGLGDWEPVEKVLSFSIDPRSRSYFITWFKQCGFSIVPLMTQFGEHADDWRSTAWIGCLANVPKHSIPETLRNEYVEWLVDAYSKHPSSRVHSSSKQLLLLWGQNDRVKIADSSSDFHGIRMDRNWYINSLGIQMNIVRSPRDFWFGLPANDSPPGGMHRLDHSFAIADTLVSELQFADFDSGRFPNPTDSPALDVTWYEAVHFCDWLNRRQRIEDRSSIEAVNQTKVRYTASETGYRLTSVWEWECFLRAGTKTSFAFGELESEYLASSSLATQSSFLEWTSTARTWMPKRILDGELGKDDVVVVKGGLAPTIKSLFPLGMYRLLKIKQKQNVGFRLSQTISEFSPSQAKAK